MRQCDQEGSRFKIIFCAPMLPRGISIKNYILCASVTKRELDLKVFFVRQCDKEGARFKSIFVRQCDQEGARFKIILLCASVIKRELDLRLFYCAPV